MKKVRLLLKNKKIVHTVTHFMISRSPMLKTIYNQMKILIKHKNKK